MLSDATLRTAAEAVPHPTYFDRLKEAMQMVAQHPRAIFLGQAVEYNGTGMSASFEGVPKDKLLELPVMEECQLGMSLGLALDGYLPVSVYPRWNFLLCACNQLVNHLDAIPRYSKFRPKVIIRTASGSSTPLNPGPQHLGDFSRAFRLMLETIDVVQLQDASLIVPAYERALADDRSTILVEYPDRYGDR